MVEGLHDLVRRLRAEAVGLRGDLQARDAEIAALKKKLSSCIGEGSGDETKSSG